MACEMIIKIKEGRVYIRSEALAKKRAKVERVPDLNAVEVY